MSNTNADAADEENAAGAAQVDNDIININKRIASIIAFISERGSLAPQSLADDLSRLEKERDRLQLRAAALRRPAARYDAEATVAAITACEGIKKQPPDQQKTLLQAAVYKVYVSPEDYKVIFNWHTCSGDEPPHPVCQSVPRRIR